VCKAENLPPSCADVTKSGGLNLMEPCGPVMGQLYYYMRINSNYKEPLIFVTGILHSVIMQKT
jgi:hypothetical protein